MSDFLYSSNSLYSDPTFDPRPKKRDPALVQLAQVFRADPPGYATGNLWTEANRFEGIVYLAIQTLCDALDSATVQLLRPRGHSEQKSFRKALPAPHAQANDERWVPVYSHALLRVLDNPNEHESFADLLARIVIQYHLHGRVLVWGNLNRAGKPGELYVLPTALCQPQPYSAEYPRGGWRLTQSYPSGTGGYLPGAMAAWAGAVLPREQVYELRSKHPIHWWSPYSPQQGGRYQLDLIEKTDRAVWSAMDRSFKPDGVLTVPGADQEQLDRILKSLYERHGGPDNKGGVIGVATSPDSKGSSSLSPWSGQPPEMYDSAWDRYTNFAVALFGLHKAVMGLTDSGSYSEFFAAAKSVHVRKYQPFCAKVARFLTRGIAADWDERLKVQVDLPQLDDPDLLERQIGTDGGLSAITVNEIRALRGRQPVDDGDLPPKIYEAVLQQKVQPPPQADPAGGDPSASPGGGDPSASPDPLADPNADPTAGDGTEANVSVPGDDTDGMADHVTQHALASLGAGEPPTGEPGADAGAAGDDGAQELMMAALHAKSAGDDDTARAILALADHPEQLGDLLGELRGGGQTKQTKAVPAGGAKPQPAAAGGVHNSAWASRHGLVFDTVSRRWKKKGGAKPPAGGRHLTADHPATGAPGEWSQSAGHINDVMKVATTAPHTLTHDHVRKLAEHIDAIKAPEARKILAAMGHKAAGGRAVETAMALYQHVRGLVKGDHGAADAKVTGWLQGLREHAAPSSVFPGGGDAKPTPAAAVAPASPSPAAGDAARVAAVASRKPRVSDPDEDMGEPSSPTNGNSPVAKPDVNGDGKPDDADRKRFEQHVRGKYPGKSDEWYAAVVAWGYDGRRGGAKPEKPGVAAPPPSTPSPTADREADEQFDDSPSAPSPADEFAPESWKRKLASGPGWEQVDDEPAPGEPTSTPAEPEPSEPAGSPSPPPGGGKDGAAGDYTPEEKESVITQLAKHKQANRDLGKLGYTMEKMRKEHPALLKQFAKQYGIEPKVGGDADTEPAKEVAAKVKTPKQKSALQRAHEWAGPQADKHAATLAAHLGVSHAEARDLLHRKIKHLAQQSLIAHERGGDTVGEYSTTIAGRGGKKFRVTYRPDAAGGGGGEQKMNPSAPSPEPAAEPRKRGRWGLGRIASFFRPKNRAGAGSLPGQQKAFPGGTFSDPAPWGYCPECRCAGVACDAAGETAECESGHQYEVDDAKWASTQIELPSGVARKLASIARRIDPADVLEIEDKSHVTCRYGLRNSHGSQVADVVEDFGPVHLRLGRLNCFRGDECDVLYAEVKSPDLHRLHKLLGELPHTDTHDGFIPHGTIAYLRPGTADKYLASLPAVDESVTVRRLTFSTAARQKTECRLAPRLPRAAAIADSVIADLERKACGVGAMNTVNGSDGGFLVPVAAGRRKKKRRR